MYHIEGESLNVGGEEYLQLILHLGVKTHSNPSSKNSVVVERMSFDHHEGKYSGWSSIERMSFDHEGKYSGWSSIWENENLIPWDAYNF